MANNPAPTATAELDRWARECVIWAYFAEYDRVPRASEAGIVQAVGRHETFYGQGWKSPPHAPDMVGSNNLGSVQCKEHWPKFGKVVGVGARPDLTKFPTPTAVPGHCALVVDSNPVKVNGKDVQSWYYGPYRVYPDPIEGFRHLVRVLGAMQVIGGDSCVAVRTPMIEACARRMYERKYYRSTKTDPSEAVAEYTTGLTKAVVRFSASLSEVPPVIGLPGTPAPAERLLELPYRLELPGPPPEISFEETLEARINDVMRVSLEDRRAARDAEIAEREEQGKL